MALTENDVLALFAGCRVTPQRAFVRIDGGGLTVHLGVNRAREVARVDIKGATAKVTHLPLVPVPREVAARRHLGRVEAQVDLQDDERARATLQALGDVMRGPSDVREATARPPPTAPDPATPISLRVTREIAEAIESERRIIANASPGMAVSFSDAVRVLLSEAVAARRAARASA